MYKVFDRCSYPFLKTYTIYHHLPVVVPLQGIPSVNQLLSTNQQQKATCLTGSASRLENRLEQLSSFTPVRPQLGVPGQSLASWSVSSASSKSGSLACRTVLTLHSQTSPTKCHDDMPFHPDPALFACSMASSTLLLKPCP